MKKLIFLLLLICTPLHAYGTNGCDSVTELLMHFDSGTITDDECRNVTRKVITNVGTTQDTTNYKFGGSSRAFDGTSQYCTLLLSNDFAMGTGDFTIDFWTRFTDVAQQNWFQNQDVSNDLDIGSSGSNLRVLLNGVEYDFAWTPSNSIWYHVAVTRSGTNLRAFINGTQIGITQTSSDSISSTATLFIGSNNGVVSFLHGNLDEYRITKGVARWTANFTPPSTPYCAGCEMAGVLND